YLIVVINCSDVDHVNLSVVGGKLGSLTNIATLPAHGSVPIHLVASHHVTTTNPVTVTGHSACDVTGSALTATATAVAHVRPIGIDCHQWVTVFTNSTTAGIVTSGTVQAS